MVSNDYLILKTFVENSKYKSRQENKTAQWEQSPFKFLLSLTSRQKGALGEEIVSELLTRKGCTITPSVSSEHDKRVNGYKCEIKLSTLWENGKYVFQQIRDQDWEYLLCLGLSPQTAHFWHATKDIM